MTSYISPHDSLLEHLGQTYAPILCVSPTYDGNRAQKSRRAALIAQFGLHSAELEQADAHWDVYLRGCYTAIGKWALWHSEGGEDGGMRGGVRPDIPGCMPVYAGSWLDWNGLPVRWLESRTSMCKRAGARRAARL